MTASKYLFILIACGCAVLLFQTSQSVQNAEAELARLERINAYTADSIQVLSAEWDYLNNPLRLERLIKMKEAQSADGQSSLFGQAQPVSSVITPTQKPAYRPFAFEEWGAQ